MAMLSNKAGIGRASRLVGSLAEGNLAGIAEGRASGAGVSRKGRW
jgi:hypothetical protein